MTLSVFQEKGFIDFWKYMPTFKAGDRGDPQDGYLFTNDANSHSFQVCHLGL